MFRNWRFASSEDPREGVPFSRLAIETEKTGSLVVSRVFKLLNDVRKDEEGATMVEYAILVTLISVVAIAVITTLGKVVNNSFNTACASMNNGSC